MKRIRNTFYKNNDFKVVVVTHNKEEFETLRDILVDMNFNHSCISFNPNEFGSLKDLMNERVEEVGYECCWRVSDYMGVCWDDHNDFNESLEHWKENCSDILEIKPNGELDWVE